MAQDVGAFVSLSVTGASCALQCDHCQSRVLEGMIPLDGAGLFQQARALAERGARGILVSGGCDKRGRVPLLRHVDDLKRIRAELGLAIRVHPGLPDEETAAALGEVDLDGAMLDIIGAEETIRLMPLYGTAMGDGDAAVPRRNRRILPDGPESLSRDPGVARLRARSPRRCL